LEGGVLLHLKSKGFCGGFLVVVVVVVVFCPEFCVFLSFVELESGDESIRILAYKVSIILISNFENVMIGF